jgi:hypothetical protein
MEGLRRGQEHILMSIFNEDVDLDLGNQSLSPSEGQGCSIF